MGCRSMRSTMRSVCEKSKGFSAIEATERRWLMCGPTAIRRRYQWGRSGRRSRGREARILVRGKNLNKWRDEISAELVLHRRALARCWSNARPHEHFCCIWRIEFVKIR